MRNVFIAVLLAAVLATFSAAYAGAEGYRLSVDGLACPFCAYGVEKQLAAIDGVGGIETDIAAGTVTVTMEADATLDEATARRAVEAAGFTLRAFEKAPPSK